MFFTPVIRRSTYYPGLHSADRAFNRAFDATFFSGASKSVNLEQDDKFFTVSFDVPGIAKEHLSIGIEGNVVRISTKPEATRPYKAAYELPLDIDAATSEAKLENGVLSLKLAKKEPLSSVTPLDIH